MTLALLAGSFVSGCVKKADYDSLQIENQALQARLDEASRQLLQAQTDVVALQTQTRTLQLMEVQAQSQKTQLQLKQSQDELNALKAEFEKFRIQRRSAMVGKKFPVLSLDGGKVLREAEITAIDAAEVAIRHDGGFVKIALANTSDPLRWEACFDPQEAKERARQSMIAASQSLDVRLARERASPAAVTIAAPTAMNAYDALKAQLATQRQQLNAEFQALSAKNPTVLGGASWNSTTPEASPLLNSISGSRAVLGISRLQSMRDAINATLQQLRGLGTEGR